MLERISSKENPNLKELSALSRDKKYRNESGLFVIEGARLCTEAVRAGIEIQTVFLTAAAMEKYMGDSNLLIAHAEVAYEIPDSIAHWAADTKNPQGLFAVCKKLDNHSTVATIEKNSRFLLLDELQDPGNMGTILRTAFSLGIDKVYISSNSVELYSPKVLRSAMGAVFQLPIEIVDDMQECIQLLKKNDVAVYAAALTKTAVAVHRSLFSGASAVVLGNEGAGLSSSVIAECVGSVMIPMAAGAESLNVANAASIFLWEMTQERVEEKE